MGKAASETPPGRFSVHDMKKKKTARPLDPVDRVNRAGMIALIVSLIAVYCVTALRMTGTLTPTMELIDGRASIRFLDVGQGDCTLVVHRGHAVLIDAGSAYFASSTAETVARYAPRLDALIVTHPHEDHMGGAEAILKAVRVEEFCLSDIPSSEAFYVDAMKAARGRNTEIVKVREPGEFLFGDIRVEFFDTFGYPWEDLNDASLAMRVTVDGLSLFIAGDAERGLEGEIAASGADCSAAIYHAGHHGSSSSSTEALLDRIDPSVAVISCGKNNPYGHPSQIVLDRFAARGIEVRRTDREGTFVIRGGDLP